MNYERKAERNCVCMFREMNVPGVCIQTHTRTDGLRQQDCLQTASRDKKNYLRSK